MKRTLSTLISEGCGQRFRMNKLPWTGIIICAAGTSPGMGPLLAVIFDDWEEITYVSRDEIEFTDLIDAVSCDV